MKSRPGNVSPRRRASAGDDWLSRIDFVAGGEAKYLAIARALAEAAGEGVLAPGARLPPQRALAAALGVDLTTVTRAYAHARAMGVLEGETGRGTFVRGAPSPAGLVVDLSMNLPPTPADADWRALLSKGVAGVLRDGDAAALMNYRAGMGARRDRAIAAEWLSPLLGGVSEARVFLAPGAQAALGALLPMLARSGDVILAEPWTYPGFIAMARLHGVRLAPLDCDDDGPVLRALDAQLKQTGAKAIYLNSTLQNPTTRTISAARRQGLVEIARKRGVLIIEDDAYGLLAPPAPAMARLDAASVIYLSTLSKCLSPGLRTAFVVAPPALEARMGDALRAACQMPTPLLSDLAMRWIESGLASRLLAGVKAESAERMRMARKLLPARARGGAHGFHLWMPLPGGWDVDAYAAAAEAQGVVTVSSDIFAVGPGLRPHVRISLGAAPNRAILERGLRALTALER